MTMPLPIELLAALFALLLAGNLLLLMAGKRRIQFVLNTVLLLLLVVAVAYAYMSGPYGLYANLVKITPFSLFFMLLFTLGMLLVNGLFYDYVEAYGPLALLSVFSLLGMYLIATSPTLVTLFIGLELVSMPMVFALLLSKRNLESAAKLFIMASIGVALFSFAMVLVYGGAGTLDMLSGSGNSELMLFASVIFIAALGFEASVFPFNILIPDVYEGAPAPLAGLFGGVSKKAGLAALIQVLILLFITYQSAFLVVAILSVLTMFYGNLAALRQRNLKRLFAYSSIAQSGYILIGIATYSNAGITAALFQIFAHSLIFIGLLAIVSWLESRNKRTIDDIVGLSQESRLAAFAATLFMLALIGLPFTTGFVGKLLIFLSAINAGLLILALLGILNSAISVYYYAKPIMSMYSHGGAKRRSAMPAFTVLAVVLCLILTVLFGIYPQPMINFASAAAGQLFA